MSTESPRIYEALRWASSLLEENGKEARAGEWLLQDLLQVKGTAFHMRLQEPISAEMWKRYQSYVTRHMDGEPVQYITGEAEFYGRRFLLRPGVLIPRPETEELIEMILQDGRSRISAPTIIDIGTGSGAIAVTLACEWPKAEVFATDISKEALAVARENAAQYPQADVHFLEGDLLQPLDKRGLKADILVSNPPYISKKELAELDPKVREYEPLLALNGGDDGLDFYRRFAEALPFILNDGSMAVFEIGDEQGRDVAALMRGHLLGWLVEVRQDINGKDRFIIVKDQKTSTGMRQKGQ